MRKHKNLILFIFLTFSRSVLMAMLKFFLRGYLSHAHISLEQIMGYLSLGAMFSYFIGGSLAYFFPKRRIINIATLVVTGCLIIGHLTGYVPFPIFVLLMSGIGLMYGFRLIMKSIILTIEIHRSQFSETSINGAGNIAILAGIILGSYLGFAAYGWRGTHGFWLLIGILGVSLITNLWMNYDQGFHKRDVAQSLKIAIPSILGVIKKYIWLLVPIGVLWAISTAMGQKMLEIGVDVFNKVPKSSILIIVISIIGAIVGHLISTLFKTKKKQIAIIFTIIMGLSTIYFPNIINKYDYYITLNIASFFIGIFFGIAVNLLEGRFYYHIGEDHRKEYGSAAYGIATNIIIFSIMIMSDVLTHRIGMIIPFVFFGCILLLMPFFIRKFR